MTNGMTNDEPPRPDHAPRAGLAAAPPRPPDSGGTGDTAFTGDVGRNISRSPAGERVRDFPFFALPRSGFLIPNPSGYVAPEASRSTSFQPCSPYRLSVAPGEPLTFPARFGKIS